MRPSLIVAAFVPFLALAAPALALTLPAVVTFDGKEEVEADLADRLNGTVANGRLVVTATERDGGQKVAYGLNGGGTPAISVDVQATYDPDLNDDTLISGAGLVVRHDDDKQSYFLFVLTRDGYTIRSYANGGFGQSIGGSLPEGLSNASPVRLSAKETSDGAQFFVNGNSVGSIADSGVTGHGLGLIHLGRGTFQFDNVAMNVKGELQPGGAEMSGDAPAPAPVADNPPPGPPPSPAPLPVLPDVKFFVGANGQSLGPFTMEELAARAKAGQLIATTYVWKPGMAAWMTAKTVPELSGLFP